MRRAARRGPEARVAGGELPRAAKGGEECGVELDVVPVRCEVIEYVGVCGSCLAEHEAVLTTAAAYVVVTGPAFDPVDAVVAAHGIVARAADDGVVAVGTQQ